MTNSIDERKIAWRPPERPEWVAAINREGDAMDIRGLVPLDELSLLRTAEQNTGLCDYGADDWREAFSIVAQGLDQDAHLNLMGRLMCRSDLLLFLEGRLRIEDTYKLHPEIEDEVITEPIFIVGQGRSGTSVLQNILAAIPGNGAVKTWEAMLPCPPPEAASYLTDPRIERADKLITQWVRVTPSIAAIHEFTGEIPCECVQFMAFSFISIWFNLLGQIPKYVEYMGRANWETAYRYHKRVIKLLQWRNPRRHFVLKSTEHLQFMPEILKIYPDACFVWPHRDPIVAVASSTSLAGTLNWMRSDRPFLHAGFENYNASARAVSVLERPIQWIADGIIPSRRLCNVQYRDIVQNPIEVIKYICRYFDLDFDSATHEILSRHIAENPRHARPQHEYHHGSAARIRQERDMFKCYQSFFGVPNEID